MKILFFLLVLANVALFMWELKQGAFVEENIASAENAYEYPERIVLVSELEATPLVSEQFGQISRPSEKANENLSTTLKTPVLTEIRNEANSTAGDHNAPTPLPINLP